MEAKAKLSYLRVTPRKMREMVDQIRGKNVNEAINFLSISARKYSATVLSRLIKSAAANADQKGTVDVDKLFIKTIFVGGGPILKRYRPRAKGSAFPIKKRTCHVTVTLSER